MTFCLDAIILKPEKGLEIENAIILLHGYGGDGQDISMLSLGWKRHLPNTISQSRQCQLLCNGTATTYQWLCGFMTSSTNNTTTTIKIPNLSKARSPMYFNVILSSK